MGIKSAPGTLLDCRALTVDDLDQRLTQVAAALDVGVVDDGLVPRAISAAELVRRVEPFLVWN